MQKSKTWGFYVGYKIPQIGKEFDLLRFGVTSIINIELKSESSTEKIKAQLLRKRYYLSFLDRTVHAFTYVSSSSTVYYLSDEGGLETSGAACLLKMLVKQAMDPDTVPDLLFNPSDYLVSPFNSTNKFLAVEYFLTHQQEEFKSDILKVISAGEPLGFSVQDREPVSGGGEDGIGFSGVKSLQRPRFVAGATGQRPFKGTIALWDRLWRLSDRIERTPRGAPALVQHS